MVNTNYTNAWIDRYLRNELTAEDETRFETALLDSPQLQDDLEASLAVRRLLQLESRFSDAQPGENGTAGEFRAPWVTMALSASLILAAVSGAMYWSVRSEVASLRNGLEELGQSHALEIVVPLDIMRTADDSLPEAIINRPESGNTVVVLDIELSAAALAAGSVRMMLRDPKGLELATWFAASIENGRVRSSFDPDYLPEGRVWLEISNENGDLLDRRLLEFR